MKYEAAAEHDASDEHQHLKPNTGQQPTAEQRKNAGHQENDICAVGDKCFSPRCIDRSDQYKFLTDRFVEWRKSAY